MAKSKKKSSKQSKAHKSNKVSKGSKVANQKAKSKAVARREQITTEPQVRTKAKQPTSVFAGVAAAIFVAITIGVMLVATAEDKAIKNPTKPTPAAGQQTIKVTEPNATGAKAEDLPGNILQGSSPQGQQTQEDLQKQQTDNPLQPNANIPDYENANLE